MHAPGKFPKTSGAPVFGRIRGKESNAHPTAVCRLIHSDSISVPGEHL